MAKRPGARRTKKSAISTLNPSDDGARTKKRRGIGFAMRTRGI
ncbi:MAG: hypothetical protein ABID38_06245 [Candidatus Diapherotrites archaeon]